MVLRQSSESSSVAIAASHLLSAWKNGERLSLDEWRMDARRMQGLDALETERMEVLESVVESLQGNRQLSSDRLRAAVRLLEHLANPAPLHQE